MTSQFLSKGHKMLNFLFAFFLKISETLKAHICKTETDTSKQQKRFLFSFNGLSYLVNNYQKFRCIGTLNALKLTLSHLFQTKICKIHLLQKSERKFVKIFLQSRVTFPLHVLLIENMYAINYAVKP